MNIGGAVTGLVLGAVLVVGGGLGLSDHLATAARADRLTAQVHRLEQRTSRLTDSLTSMTGDRNHWQGCSSTYRKVGQDEVTVMATMSDALESMRQATIAATTGDYYSADSAVVEATSTIDRATSQAKTVLAEEPTGCDGGGS